MSEGKNKFCERTNDKHRIQIFQGGMGARKGGEKQERTKGTALSEPVSPS